MSPCCSCLFSHSAWTIWWPRPLPPPQPAVAGRNGMCPNYNRGHRPASAGSSHFIGWKKKQLWSAQEGGKRPGREEGSWAGARQGQAGLLLPQSTGCGGWSWRKKIIIIPSTTTPGTLDKSACSLNSDPKLLPLHHIPVTFLPTTPPAKPHFLEALGLCWHFSEGLRLTSSALTIPGYTWVYHGPD